MPLRLTNHSLSRRRWLCQSAALGAGLLLAGNIGLAAEPTAVVHSLKTISHQPELYYGWPTLTRRKNGELLVVWSGSREGHVCPFGRVEMMSSQDDGQTWTWDRVLLDLPIDDRDAGVLETAQGTILVTTFSSLAYDDYYLKKMSGDKPAVKPYPEEKMRRWLSAHNRINEEQRQGLLGTWMLRSTDGGLTFSAPYRVPLNSPHGPIQLADGRLLYPGKELWTESKRIGVAESRDDGATWNWLAEIPTRSGDSVARGYHELHGVEAADGTIIVHIRNHNTNHTGETLQTESKDGGKTWSEPHPIGVWGLPSFLNRLQDGRLLMTYGYRRKPFGNQARVSADNGQTWSEALTISDDGASGDLGYPSTVQLADGSLLTVWYELTKDSPRAVLRQAHWELK
ncbi:MAG: sialidase family protein [Planctomycetaceae bacterium]|nr:exo-alpha-sialidase [Planctomycetaceae bacterium]